MRKLAAVLLTTAMLIIAMPAWPADNNTGGEVVWEQKTRGEIIAKISRITDPDTGLVEYTVWSKKEIVYQEYPVISAGYNGATVKIIVREIRPSQPKSDMAHGYGMRDPATLFRAGRVEWGVKLARDDGSTLIIEVRPVSGNYIIMLTEIGAQRAQPSGPPTKLGFVEEAE